MPTALPTVKKKFSWIWCEQSELKINPRKKKSWSFTLLIKMCVRFFMNLTAKTQSNAIFFRYIFRNEWNDIFTRKKTVRNCNWQMATKKIRVFFVRFKSVEDKDPNQFQDISQSLFILQESSSSCFFFGVMNWIFYAKF